MMNISVPGMPPQFGPETSDNVKGKWINKNTGDTVMVRDIVFADNGMNVITNMGMLSGDQFADYIKCSEELYDTTGKVIGTQEVKTAEIKKPVSTAKKPAVDADLVFSGMTTTVVDDSIVNITPEEAVDIYLNGPAPVTPKPESVDTAIIDKMLSKISKPKITLNIEWDDFPQEQIDTLINFLDIDIDEFVHYLAQDFPKKEYNDLIKSYIEKELQK